MRTTSLIAVMCLSACGRYGFESPATPYGDPSDPGDPTDLTDDDEPGDPDVGDDDPGTDQEDPRGLVTLGEPVTFAEVILGESSPTTTVTATNSGSGDATLGALGGVTGVFTRDGGTCTSSTVLAPSQSCTITLSFTPVSVGHASTTLTLDYHDGVEATSVSLSLSGTARDPVACDELAANENDHAALGSGTPSDPHIICTPRQLLDIASRVLAWKKSFALGKDLDMTGFHETSTPQFRPIGTLATPFTGRFDGRGHSITNLRYHSASVPNVGLFGYAKGSATEIKNLSLVNVDFEGPDGAAGLVGHAERITVSNCHVTGSVAVTGTADEHGDAAGLVSFARRGTVVSGSSAHVSVTAADYGCGGLVGYGTGVVLSNSYATGDVSCVGYGGGLAASITQESTVSNCYATGDVMVTGINGGGLLGATSSHSTVDIRRSFATGDVTCGAAATCGRFIGEAIQAAVADSYSLEDSTCTAPAACHATLSGETVLFNEDELYSALLQGLDDWDVEHVWQLEDDAFPTLAPSVFDATTWGDCAAHASDTPYAGGFGTAEFPYLICTAAQLVRVASNPVGVNMYRLMADIDMTGVSTSAFPIDTLFGVFDGDGHSVIGLELTGVFGVGMFQSVRGVVRRLGLVDVTSTGSDEVCALTIGFGGAIFDSYVTGTLNSTGFASAMACDTYGGGEISNSYTHVTITADNGGGFMDATFNNAHYSFATGSTTFTTGGGPFVAGGILDAAGSGYFAEDQCSGCTNDMGTPVNVAADPDYFYDKTLAPLNTWDFDNIWRENPGALPTLR